VLKQGSYIKTEQILVNKKDYEKLVSDNKILAQQLKELQRMIFGKKSERFVKEPDQQLSLFEDVAEQEPAETEKQEITYTREKQKKEKQKPVRQKIPAHLPRVIEVIEPKDLPENAKKIGESITEILEYTAAKIFVRKIIRPKYSLKDQDKIVISDLPSLPIPKANAGASLLTYIIVSKFVDHLPLHRLRQIFKREDLDIKSATIGGWFSKISDLLVTLYEKHRQQTIETTNYLQADESPIKVQDKDKKNANHQGYMWVYQNIEKRLILFEYNKSRGQVPPKEMLKNFQGTLQTDGYKVYGSLANAMDFRLLACMAHIRRYFEKALDNDITRSEYVLFKIQALYTIERKLKEEKATTEEIKNYRQKNAKPILEDMEKYMQEQVHNVLPKSSIGIAFRYALKIFSNMKVYIEDGNYKIDNNLTENAIRPLAIGRKNYLFAGSHRAAQNYAMFYSFFATCKANNVNPSLWLEDVLNRIPNQKVNNLDVLLPNNWKKQ